MMVPTPAMCLGPNRIQGNPTVVSISFKEILLIGAIIGGMIWMRMAQETLEASTSNFVKKLKGPGRHGPGFGWRGLIVAFVVGIVSCCAFGYVVFRIVSLFYGRTSG